jgi:hypothetical protein
MARYTVPLTSWANIAVDVEVSDDATPEDIVNAAIEAASPSLCHQCNSSRNDSLEIGDDWEPVTKYDGQPGYEYTRLDD